MPPEIPQPKKYSVSTNQKRPNQLNTAVSLDDMSPLIFWKCGVKKGGRRELGCAEAQDRGAAARMCGVRTCEGQERATCSGYGLKGGLGRAMTSLGI